MHIGSTDNRKNKQIYSKKNGREAPISSSVLERPGGEIESIRLCMDLL